MLAARLAARLREPSGAEEEWIARLPELRVPRVCHELLARCLGTPGEPVDADLDLVRSLTLAERDWLLMQLHQHSFGAEIAGEVRCPACQSVNEIRFSARDLVQAPESRPAPMILTLPSGATAEVRPLTAADHEHFAALGSVDEAAQQGAVLARQMLVRADGNRDAVADWDDDDRREIVKAAAATAPEPVQLELSCHSCAASFTSPFDLGRFVVVELLEHSRTLLDDVHVLARTYHWSEPEIFRLPLKRRLAYLSRIDADRGIFQEHLR